MSITEQTGTGAREAAVRAAFAQATICENTERALRSGRHPLALAAAERGFGSHFGHISAISRWTGPATNVTFADDNGTSYGSLWPDWTLDLAWEAFRSGRSVWVLTRNDTDVPSGANLVSVMIFD